MDLSTILVRRADFAPDKKALVFEGQSLSYAEFCSRAARPPHDWFATGDVGHRDQDGFYYIDDRIKDMVISGGENIYPAEVENALYDHPAVAEVAVIGIPHPRWVEIPIAVVVARTPTTGEDLVAHCRTRLAHFKAPRTVFFVDSLPRNAMGKVQKFKLREEYTGKPLPG
jgi:fatty-acyl-CoA synthase